MYEDLERSLQKAAAA